MGYQARSAKSSAFAKNALLAAVSAASAGMAAPAHAAGTLAGTNITNVATATYDLPNGTPTSVDSNTVTLKVDELLDVTVAWRDPADVVSAPGLAGQVLSFTVTNAGNGPESYTLGTIANGGGDDFDPTVTALFLDSNANGAFDAGVDTAYVPGVNDPQLAPDGSATVFVLSTIPLLAADGNRGKVDLTAVARTGSGTPGTSFAGQGEGGGNAVVGATGAKAQDDGWYAVRKASLSFVKSATVADPFGGTTQGPGAVITYTLTATVSGNGSLANVKVSDAVPAGTTYQAGSLTLDAASLTDAADSDAGSFDGTAVSVGLGSVAAGTTKIVKFKVKID
ncbi:MAG: DUF11 domain-containing protein [Alphaproteobacteria bacterium]|nr:DUF11 domain-containing protein [Alphaproteobacteria bacterium]MBV9373230.1 DUF11 domain-containing protein [Alphaproteobacteria bacterium]MBV9900618.1 DUF11 domain-containing protein [Alphaproteobacteria bacterium]